MIDFHIAGSNADGRASGGGARGGQTLGCLSLKVDFFPTFFGKALGGYRSRYWPNFRLLMRLANPPRGVRKSELLGIVSHGLFGSYPIYYSVGGSSRRTLLEGPK